MIGNASLHRRGHSQCPMDSPEIIIHKMEGVVGHFNGNRAVAPRKKDRGRNRDQDGIDEVAGGYRSGVAAELRGCRLT